MNATRAATLLATALSAETGLAALDVLPAGSEDEANLPFVIITLTDFEEHEVLLGSHEGKVSARLVTVPADTTVAVHRGYLESIAGFLCSVDWMNAAVFDYLEFAEIWDIQTTLLTEDNARVSEVSTSACIIEKA